MSNNVVVCAMYKFAVLNDYKQLRQPLLNLMLENDVHGTLLLAREGINGTIAGSRDGIDAVKAWIASDERFGMCAVRQMVEQLHQTESPITDIERLKPHREAFIQGGQSMRALVRSIVLSSEYSVGRWEEGLDDRNARLLHVDQLASSVEAHVTEFFN